VTGWLAPVRAALDASARETTFFFRDDDAGWDDEALFALLDLFHVRGLPLDLAVIPAVLSPGLARDLARRATALPELLGLHQHGFTHANHEQAGRSCEFGAARPRAAQLADIAAGQRRLDRLLPGLVEPIFTPPWNRCTADTGSCLVELGIGTLSRDSTAVPLGLPALHELPVRVDWLARRRRTALGRPQVGLLLAAAIGADRPVGVMFHHAAMDAASRAATAELLDLLVEHPGARCTRMGALTAPANREVIA
jgi:hypothetical protein